MTESTQQNLFELSAIQKSFGDTKVLTNFDFAIERGKTTVVIGPSGCGKTVLLKLLILLLRPDRGKVFFDGRRIDPLPESRLVPVRARCGFLFQAGALFDSQTVFENIAFPLYQHTDHSHDEIRQIVRNKLRLVALEPLENRYPAELSGGQQKRIALARAIALSPEVVLYDEPTTGLDPIRSDIIGDLILKLKTELRITSVVVTHDMKLAAKIGDRIVMMSQGRIIADGTADEIYHSTDPVVQQFVLGRSAFAGGVHLD